MTAVLERRTTDETARAAAELEWKAIAEALASGEIRVLRAATYDIRDQRGRVHVVALTNIVNGRRFFPGLEEGFSPIAAESAICALPGTLESLHFRIWRSRKEEDSVGVPTCSRCITILKSVTKQPNTALLTLAKSLRIRQVTG